MIEIKWLGRGGQGAFTASRLLGLSASLFEGKSTLAFPSFGPERRGAPVQAFTKLDDSKITDRSEIQLCDYIVVLDDTLADENLTRVVKPGGTVLINTRENSIGQSTDACRIVTIDATSLALEILKRPVTNTAMFGALVGISGIITLESAIKGIEKEMSPSLVSKNVEILKRAYQLVKGGTN